MKSLDLNHKEIKKKKKSSELRASHAGSNPRPLEEKRRKREKERATPPHLFFFLKTTYLSCRERSRDRNIIHLLVYFPNGHNMSSWSKGRSPQLCLGLLTGAIPHCFPGLFAGLCLKTRFQTQSCLFEVQVTVTKHDLQQDRKRFEYPTSLLLSCPKVSFPSAFVSTHLSAGSKRLPSFC